MLDRHGREIGNIYYLRPDSKERRNYLFQVENGLSKEANLSEISRAALKQAAIYEIVIRDLAVPFAKKVYVRCDGGFEVDGKRIEDLASEAQFEALSKYYDHVLIKLVEVAYSAEGVLVKKD